MGLRMIPVMRAALVAIQELHKQVTVYEVDHEDHGFKLNDEGERIVVARLCNACTPQSVLDLIEDAEYDIAGEYGEVSCPCPTRRLADDALGGTK